MKTKILKNGSVVKNRISLKTGLGGSWLDKFVLWIFIDFKDTFKTGESLLIIFFQLISFTYSE